jgi:hypothetical protein
MNSYYREICESIRRPSEIFPHELQPGRTYTISGHWLGDFVGELIVEGAFQNYKLLRVVRAITGEMQPGVEIEVWVHHCSFYSDSCREEPLSLA